MIKHYLYFVVNSKVEEEYHKILSAFRLLCLALRTGSLNPSRDVYGPLRQGSFLAWGREMLLSGVDIEQLHSRRSSMESPDRVYLHQPYSPSHVCLCTSFITPDCSLSRKTFCF